MSSWKYYNHAVIPTTAPHETVDITDIENGDIWKQYPKALLARWTTNWDCGHETNWWFLIKDSSIVLEELSSHSRKHIRQGIAKCEVKVIDSSAYAEELYACSHAAFAKYGIATNEISKEEFIINCKKDSRLTYFAGFENESKKLIGYLLVREDGNYAEIITAKFDPSFLNTHVSDALYYVVINNYLSNKKKGYYVCSGERNINHLTNTQEYKEKTFGYRKAYCKLHIAYRPWFGMVVKLIYPFRKALMLFDSVKFVHLINGVLRMEEIQKNENR